MPKYVITDDYISDQVKAKYEEEIAQGRALFDASNLISEAMYRKNISQNEMAEKIGVSKGYASRILSGTENVSLKNLARILHLLGEKLVLDTIPGNISEVQNVIWADFSQHKVDISFDLSATEKSLAEWSQAADTAM